jgi:hypothetical protein
MVRKIGKSRKAKIGSVKRSAVGKSRRKRRSKVSGMDTGMNVVMKAALLGAGAITGRELNAALVSMYPTLDPTMSGIGQAAIGILIPMLVPNEPLIEDFGNGMVAQGLMVIAVSQISQLQGVPTSRTINVRRKIGNAPNYNTIAGGYSVSRLNGNPQYNTVAGAKRRRKVPFSVVARHL